MREVKTSDWSAFCDRVNQNGRGCTVSVQKLDLDGRRSEISRNAEFDGIEFGKRDDCNDQISIRGSAAPTLDHDIVEPIHIKLMESEGGSAFRAIMIEAEDGVTQIDFQPVIKATWLEGIDLQ